MEISTSCGRPHGQVIQKGGNSLKAAASWKSRRVGRKVMTSKSSETAPLTADSPSRGEPETRICRGPAEFAAQMGLCYGESNSTTINAKARRECLEIRL